MKTTEQKVPALRFSEFEGEWEVKKLGEVTKINQGLQIPIANRLTIQVENSYFYITNEFLKEGSIKKYFITAPSKNVLCNEDDVLMTRTGNTGQVVTGVAGAFHNNFFKIVFDRKKYNKSFFVYFLNLENTQKQIIRYAGTSTIPDLNHSDFYRLLFNFPSFEEQKKIADFLSATDKRLDLLKERKQGLEDYKRGAMQGIFSQELRFTRADGSAYEDWEEKKLGEVCECLDNQRIPLNSSERASKQGKYPYWGANNIVDYIDEYIFDQTIILLAEDGGNFHEFQTKAIANIFTGKCWVNNHVHVLSANQEYSNHYIYYQLVHKNITAFINGGTRTKLNQKDMLLIPLKLPCLEEQTQIANFLSAIDVKIEKLSEQIEATENYKKGLLQQMFV